MSTNFGYLVIRQGTMVSWDYRETETVQGATYQTMAKIKDDEKHFLNV
jgi:hypothetical protein